MPLMIQLHWKGLGRNIDNYIHLISRYVYRNTLKLTDTFSLYTHTYRLCDYGNKYSLAYTVPTFQDIWKWLKPACILCLVTLY